MEIDQPLEIFHHFLIDFLNRSKGPLYLCVFTQFQGVVELVQGNDYSLQKVLQDLIYFQKHESHRGLLNAEALLVGCRNQLDQDTAGLMEGHLQERLPHCVVGHVELEEKLEFLLGRNFFEVLNLELSILISLPIVPHVICDLVKEIWSIQLSDRSLHPLLILVLELHQFLNQRSKLLHVQMLLINQSTDSLGMLCDEEFDRLGIYNSLDSELVLVALLHLEDAENLVEVLCRIRLLTHYAMLEG